MTETVFPFFGAQDPVASEATGGPLPDVSSFRARQAHPFEGAWLPARAIELLGQLGEGLVLGRFARSGKRGQLAALEEAGLLEEGRPTEAGALVHAAMESPEASFRIAGGAGGRQSLYQAWVREGLATVVAGPGAESMEDPEASGRPSPEHLNVKVVPLLDLSTDMARWVGLAPAWNLGLEPETIGVDVFSAKLAGGRPQVPAGANGPLAEVLDAPWFFWMFEGACPAYELDPMTHVNTGRRGQYRIGQPDGGDVLLLPAGSSYVFDQLEDRIQAMVHQRRITLP
jgi:hypothetical protein